MAKSIYFIDENKIEQTKMKVCENQGSKLPAKRINIVSLKIVREGSILYNVRKITSPSDAVDLGRMFLEDADREQMVLLSLDTKNTPVSISVVSVGTLNSSLCHPREIFKNAILSNAASIILYHNHPSGDPSQSSEDTSLTIRIKEAGKIIGIELLDHIIIGGSNRYCSLKEKGVI